MKLIIRNEGLIASGTNVSATLTAIDTNAVVRAESNPVYGDIAVGESATTAGFYRIRFNDVEPDTVYAYFKLDIASDGFVFWTDTMSIFVRREGVGIQDEFSLPSKFSLHDNYPNPFNPVTTIQYDLPEQSFVKITIYDLLGRVVATLVNHIEEPGFKSIVWNATSEQGQLVCAEMYIYQIKAGDFVQTRKMILLK